MNTPAPRVLRSILAVLLGIVTVFVLSFGTDQLLHMLDIYPPLGKPMYETGLNVLALSYRIVYGIVGGYVTARLSPHHHLKHAMIYGWIGFGFSTVGAVGGILVGGLGPTWYPVLLALTARLPPPSCSP
jgi:hypothetical protein